MPRFQVGDRVRVIESTQRAPGALRGQTGTVTEVRDEETVAGSEETQYTVRFDGLGREMPLYESALEAGAGWTAAPVQQGARGSRPPGVAAAARSSLGHSLGSTSQGPPGESHFSNDWNMRWYFEVLKKYAVFSGRARRAEYWWFWLTNLIIGLPLALIDGSFNADGGFSMLTGIYTLAVLLPAFGVLVRRLHDIGSSGWWVLIAAVPFIGPLWLLSFLATEGKGGPNQYGPDPRAA